MYKGGNDSPTTSGRAQVSNFVFRPAWRLRQVAAYIGGGSGDIDGSVCPRRVSSSVYRLNRRTVTRSTRETQTSFRSKFAHFVMNSWRLSVRSLFAGLTISTAAT